MSSSGMLGQGGDERITHMEEAVAFARKYWKKRLVVENWPGLVEYRLINTKGDIWKDQVKATVGLSRDVNDLINDHSKPLFELVDESVVIVTTDTHEMSEMKAYRGLHHGDTCKYCGGQLTWAACLGCGRQFNSSGMIGGVTPMSPKIEKAFLDSGHVFEIDPSIAYEKARETWRQRFKK